MPPTATEHRSSYTATNIPLAVRIFLFFLIQEINILSELLVSGGHVVILIVSHNHPYNFLSNALLFS